MTSRERMLAAMEFRNPDRIPVVYHASTAGLFVHGQKLLDLFRRYPPDHPASFDVLPAPPAGTVGTDGRYHELRKDEWGTTWEFLIFGIQGHPKAYPFPDWASARDYAFPPAPSVTDSGFEGHRRWVREQQREFLVFAGWGSLLEKLCALRPMDEVLVDLQLRDPDLMVFLDRLEEYTRQVVDYHVALGSDAYMFGDDWGTQTAPVLSPALFREVFKPRLARLMTPLKAAGQKVFYHSCGCLGPVLDDLFDLGIDGLWPQIRFYDDDRFAERCRERGVTIYIHPDRQHLVPRGTPAEIESSIARFAERYHRLGGGAIFYIEIENDAPFDNVRALIEAVDRYR